MKAKSSEVSDWNSGSKAADITCVAPGDKTPVILQSVYIKTDLSPCSLSAHGPSVWIILLHRLFQRVDSACSNVSEASLPHQFHLESVLQAQTVITLKALPSSLSLV